MEFYTILKMASSGDYALLDSGAGEKLERYGDIIVARPDPQALWRKCLPEAEWKKAQAYFKRDSKSAEWETRGELPERWKIDFGGLKFWIKLSAFKHTGLFPEHATNWEWIRNVILSRSEGSKRRDDLDSSVAAKPPQNDNVKMPKVLNLFGYTGGATLAAAQAGAEVVHVDGSKVAVNWARDNAEASGLKDKPIRWILDDAWGFVKREIRRGNKYDAIIMDPPAFGHGPKRELWKIEESFLPLLDDCKKILSEKPLFFLVNGYASGYSAVAYKNSLSDLLKEFGGNIEIGELTIQEASSARLLPAGIFARWQA